MEAGAVLMLSNGSGGFVYNKFVDEVTRPTNEVVNSTRFFPRDINAWSVSNTGT